MASPITMGLWKWQTTTLSYPKSNHYYREGGTCPFHACLKQLQGLKRSSVCSFIAFIIPMATQNHSIIKLVPSTPSAAITSLYKTNTQQDLHNHILPIPQMNTNGHQQVGQLLDLFISNNHIWLLLNTYLQCPPFKMSHIDQKVSTSLLPVAPFMFKRTQKYITSPLVLSCIVSSKTFSAFKDSEACQKSH